MDARSGKEGVVTEKQLSAADSPATSRAPVLWSLAAPLAPTLAAVLPVLLDLDLAKTIVLGAVLAVYIVCGAVVQIATTRGASQIAMMRELPPVAEADGREERV
jgi:hypothetical protein